MIVLKVRVTGCTRSCRITSSTAAVARSKQGADETAANLVHCFCSQQQTTKAMQDMSTEQTTSR